MTTSLEKKIDEVLAAHLQEVKAGHDLKIKTVFLQLLIETIEAIVLEDEDRDWDGAAAVFDLGYSAAIAQMTTNMANVLKRGKK